jgi:hypothetical protein
MILIHNGRKEAEMHTLVATTILTESGETNVIECDVCGFLSIVTGSPVDFMLDHAREVAL